MRIIFTLIFLGILSAGQAQTVCVMVDEGQTAELTAPPGSYFISVTFASYGTPDGACGAFTLGGCDESASVSIVESYVLGNNSASIPADNGIFGDPCGGTFKRLYIQAVYSQVAPLKLIAFSGTAAATGFALQWQTSDEVNTQQFGIERSEDGKRFVTVSNLPAANRAGLHDYYFRDNPVPGRTYYYRLKMQDMDGKFMYSNIIRLTDGAVPGFRVFPNPASNQLSLTGLREKGTIELVSITGQVLKQFIVRGQSQVIDIEAQPSGLYILRYKGEQTTTSCRIIKQ